MRRTLAIIIATVVGTLTLATPPLAPSAQAQTSEPTAVYRTYLPLVTLPSSGQSPAEESMAAQVLALVNSERTKAGCSAVTIDARLADAALGHSEDMALNDYFSHTGADGSSPFERITAAGYDWSTAGENIAAGYDTAAEVMTGWMNSSGHRANILNCSFTQIGVGYYYEEGDPDSYRHYWTQVFGRP